MTQLYDKIYDLIIVGAGPAGLEAAIQAGSRGLSYLLIDKDDVGSLIANTMANKKFLHVYGRNTATLKGQLPFPDHCIGEELVKEWKKLAEGLNFYRGAHVMSSRREGDTFMLETRDVNLRTKKLLISTGIFEHHRELNVPGSHDNSNIRYSLDYYDDFEGKNIVVVGGGNSAVEAVLYCAPNNKVTMVVRGESLAVSVTDANRNDITQFASEGRITIRFKSTVQKMDGDKIFIQESGELKEYPYDIVFAFIGFVSPSDYLVRMGVPIESGKPIFNTETLDTPVPGLYVAGSLTGADSIIESANQGYDIAQKIG